MAVSCCDWSTDVHWRLPLSLLVVTQLVTRPLHQPDERGCVQFVRMWPMPKAPYRNRGTPHKANIAPITRVNHGLTPDSVFHGPLQERLPRLDAAKEPLSP